MKKVLFSLAASVLILAACNQRNSGNATGIDSNSTAATEVDSANAPVVKFEVGTHDFGKVKQGEKVNFEYKFTNTGKSPLVISNATASCGCTVPEWPKTPVKPGQSAAIKVTFDSANKSGLQDKLITVTANTIPAQTVVHLVGEVTTK
ncbi:DUF1573 domain-containing protein [Mucilaginibacter sp. UR6-1]|uniref:DUF1573 domain-containing protein n=1 Tax=Mucilaginibacter sp. UR6-1 TaxID=1435643 RepID=UPI001E5CB743|nr:DUF1573 domain-containing protein [Mucilaginibacter sp. UR6-1]MCC8409012.1 DUF1573 domain-containing protein [Mucilaginibacter sp. UR6-1]